MEAIFDDPREVRAYLDSFDRPGGLRELGRGRFGATPAEREVIRRAFRDANEAIPPRWREPPLSCRDCTDRVRCRHHTQRCGRCDSEHSTAFCRLSWWDYGFSPLTTERVMTVSTSREEFRRVMRWKEAIKSGLIFRSGVAVPGRAYCAITCGSAWWNGQETFVPAMPYGGVYVPTLCPEAILRRGVSRANAIDVLPPQSQLPGSFVPQVVWRGAVKTEKLEFFIAALGYGPSDYDGPWSFNILRMMWETSQAGLRLNIRGWLDWHRARSRVESGSVCTLYNPSW